MYPKMNTPENGYHVADTTQEVCLVQDVDETQSTKDKCKESKGRGITFTIKAILHCLHSRLPK